MKILAIFLWDFHSKSEKIQFWGLFFEIQKNEKIVHRECCFEAVCAFRTFSDDWKLVKNEGNCVTDGQPKCIIQPLARVYKKQQRPI